MTNTIIHNRRLDPDTIAQGIALAQTSTYYGIRLTQLNRDELLAVAAHLSTLCSQLLAQNPAGYQGKTLPVAAAASAAPLRGMAPSHVILDELEREHNPPALKQNPSQPSPAAGADRFDLKTFNRQFLSVFKPD